MNLPPPIPGVPPPPPGGARPAMLRRSVRVALLVLVVLMPITAGVVGAYIGVTIADRTDTITQPSRRPVTVGADDTVRAGALDVAAVLATMEPSVVTISSDLSGGGSATGTGIVVTTDGEILTNAHVVEGASAVRVRLPGETDPRPATLLAADSGNDLALLRVDVDGLVPAVFAAADSVRVGDEVIAIGYALDLDGDPSVTRGIVSAVDRTLLGDDGALDGLIQTDAAISSGNSGGPLINARAEVVGINTAVYQSDATTAANSVGFAISSGEALTVIDELRAEAEGEQRVEGFLGVGLEDRRDGGQGAVISEVQTDSPAETAGFEVGDVVVEADGATVNGSAGLIAIIRDASPGDTVNVTVQRDGQTLDLEATLVERGS